MGLKQIGGTVIRAQHRLTCHCSAVELLRDLPDGVIDPRRCDCSHCRRRGTIVASVPLGRLHVVKGAEHLHIYQFNTRTARHYFCGVCGIHAHHQRRSHPDQYAYNVGCLEGVNPFAIADVPTRDGVHHPSDRPEAWSRRRWRCTAQAVHGGWPAAVGAVPLGRASTSANPKIGG